MSDEERGGEARGRSSSSSNRAPFHQASVLAATAATGQDEGEGLGAAQHQEEDEGGQEAEVGGGDRTRHDDEGGRRPPLWFVLCGREGEMNARVV